MTNYSKEQKDFLQKLSDWSSSEDCKQTVFNRVCSALQELIKMKEKSGEKLKLNILSEKITEENAKRTKTNRIIESFHRRIEKCYENDYLGPLLLETINNIDIALINNIDIDIAKERMLTSEVKREIPSDSLLEWEIEEKQKEKKLENLISILDEWIGNPDNFATFQMAKISAIQAKYQKYRDRDRDEYIDNGDFSYLCDLSRYADNPEEAKAFLSEIFTSKQETFYSNLEKWTESIEDTNCGKWLNAYLHKGRNLRIHNIAVLKYVNDIDKAKTFLLSKYNEKLDWDKKKKELREKEKELREKKWKSVFDNYNGSKNSLEAFVPRLINGSKLYSMCLSSNVKDKVKPLTLMSCEKGVEIKGDSIKLGSVEYHLSLLATNQLFYTYSSTYRKHTKTFTFCSPFVLSIIKKYCSAFLDKALLEHTMGCIIIRDFDFYNRNSIEGYTCLLTDEASQFRKQPIFIYEFTDKSNKFFHDIVGYRFVFKALIWHLLKDRTNSIDFSARRDFSIEERNLLFDLIDISYKSMSFEDKYICHFINTEKYKFPNEERKHVFIKQSLTDRIINLKNCICYQYNTRLLEDRFFQFAKVEYEYGDTNFKKLVDTIGGYISRGWYLDVWFNSISADFISKLRVLLFLNWVYVSNETGNIKKITACWLIHIIYEQYKASYERDKTFWTIMLAYILIENQSIFSVLIYELKINVWGCEHKKDTFEIDPDIDVESIIIALTKNIKKQKKRLTFEQKRFLSKNIYKCTLFEDYREKNKKAKCCKLDVAESIIKGICDLIAEHQGIINDYSKKTILELLTDVQKFVIPKNFVYTNRRSNSYDKYNGNYQGTYAYDEMGYSNSDIDTIFDGDPNAYWNID